MMVYFVWFLALLLLLSIILFVMMAHAFKNPVRKHDEIPDLPPDQFREIQIPARNNRKLYGWWFPAGKEAPVLILVHGWGRNVDRLKPYIEKLRANGHHLLAFDSRNHGNSDADGYSTMVKFAEDIICSIDYAHQLPEATNKEVHVIGLSIGGAASVYAASLDERIRKVVTVGAFAHPSDIMRRQFRKRYIPEYPFIRFLFSYFEWKIGFRFDDIAPERNIDRSRADFLIIHGNNDTVIPVEQARKLITSARPDQSRLWVIEGRGHSDCHHEAQYWERIGQFLS